MKIALTLSILAVGVLLAADNSETEAKSKIKPLQNELIDTLKKVAETSEVLVRNGRMSVIDAMQDQRAYLDATLDISENNQERISILEAILEKQKTFESIAEALKRDARVTEVVLLKAKAERIKAEIALEKERSNGVK
jgi:acetolactate synthase small subunit